MKNFHRKKKLERKLPLIRSSKGSMSRAQNGSQAASASKSAGNKPAGNKPAGNKPAGNKSAGNKPAGNKPAASTWHAMRTRSRAIYRRMTMGSNPPSVGVCCDSTVATLCVLEI